MATLSAPLLRSHAHRRALFPPSPRRGPTAAVATSLLGFVACRPLSSRRLPNIAARSSSTAPPSAPETSQATDDAAAAQTVAAGEGKEEKRVVLPTNESSEGLLRIRHTCAHVMAMAVQKLFPNAKVTIGPWIDNGFYYDFDVEPLTDKDLKKIKKEMVREEWWDLCAGPHVESTGKINRKAVELESVAGAYWRGNENNQMLQRIYGTAWENEDQLKAYIHFKEEAKRRDHRRLGQDLDLFSIQEDQIRDEIRGVLDLTEQILGQFGFRGYEINLSTRPEKSVGNDDIWEKATIALKEALDDKGWEYKVDEGGGAFYGPKIDLKIEDALGRKWQCSTVQVDFNLPERFDITYVDSNTEKKRPIMIHRAVLGSLERFFGVLIEHYAGDFPLWLAPTQARILPVTDNELQYCKEVASEMKSRGFRVEVCHGERLPKLIRNAETQKVPLMAVVGPKEVQGRTLTIRSRHNEEIGTMPVDEFITDLNLLLRTSLRCRFFYLLNCSSSYCRALDIQQIHNSTPVV
ncbi:hypothetical protein PR202_ga02533 [Eleusine coracana subsp. coracana]|uniref:threonine--tRNA ligase n=1 Tax=Eleusine coracana subsp. coracana TaxID=191504 RepID=A0AAV5BJQ0_ELECO|nr:hypothetical protein PR202_ga02533 [Eleusine coracana subsp. coracana]